VAEQWVGEFGNIAKTTNTVIIPAPMGDVSGMIATAMSVLQESKAKA
jgi:hypothetical protein